MLEMWLAMNANVTWKDILEAIDSPAMLDGVHLSPVILQSNPISHGMYNYELLLLLLEGIFTVKLQYRVCLELFTEKNIRKCL